MSVHRSPDEFIDLAFSRTLCEEVPPQSGGEGLKVIGSLVDVDDIESCLLVADGNVTARFGLEEPIVHFSCGNSYRKICISWNVMDGTPNPFCMSVSRAAPRRWWRSIVESARANPEQSVFNLLWAMHRRYGPLRNDGLRTFFGAVDG